MRSEELVMTYVIVEHEIFHYNGKRMGEGIR